MPVEAVVYHLEALAPFHLGEAAGTMDRVSAWVRSDTLFSGICHAWRRLFGDESLEELHGTFLEDPPFLVSSAFPCRLEGDNPTYLVPKPRGVELALTGKAGPETLKALKKLPLLTLEFYRETFVEGRRETLDYGRVEEQTRICGESTISYVKISASLCRRSMAAVPFPVALVMPAEGWGYYFIALFRDGACRDDFEAALRLLGDMGLGGDRTYGYGTFRVEKGDARTFEGLIKPGTEEGGDQEEEKSTPRWMNLSLVYPGKKERNQLKGCMVNLEQRKGWVYSPPFDTGTRRKRVGMISEGSVLVKRAKGALVDVTPSAWSVHRVYRYGLGVYMPLEKNPGVNYGGGK